MLFTAEPNKILTLMKITSFGEKLRKEKKWVPAGVRMLNDYCKGQISLRCAIDVLLRYRTTYP